MPMMMGCHATRYLSQSSSCPYRTCVFSQLTWHRLRRYDVIQPATTNNAPPNGCLQYNSQFAPTYMSHVQLHVKRERILIQRNLILLRILCYDNVSWLDVSNIKRVFRLEMGKPYQRAHKHHHIVKNKQAKMKDTGCSSSS